MPRAATKQTAESESDQREIMGQVALAHVAVLFQCAKGDYKESPDKLTQRFQMVVSYLQTGQLSVGPAERELAAKLSTWLSSQPLPAESQ